MTEKYSGIRIVNLYSFQDLSKLIKTRICKVVCFPFVYSLRLKNVDDMVESFEEHSNVTDTESE